MSSCFPLELQPSYVSLFIFRVFLVWELIASSDLVSTLLRLPSTSWRPISFLLCSCGLTMYKPSNISRDVGDLPLRVSCDGEDEEIFPKLSLLEGGTIKHFSEGEFGV